MNILVAILSLLQHSNVLERTDMELDRRLVPKAYCGVYAVYGAVNVVLESEGKKIQRPFEDLLTPEYVSSFSGSSNLEIENAVKYLGSAARSYRFLSWRSLVAAKTPMILHTSSRGQIGVYSHWLLFLGIKDGYAVIRDGIGSDILMELSELMISWDGTAVAVFPRTQEPPAFLSNEVLHSSALLGGIGFILFMTSNLSYGFRRLPSIFAFFCGAILAVLFCYFINSHTLVSERIAQSAAYQTESRRFPLIEYEELRKLQATNSATIIDCRYRSDYSRGHIEKATNLPVDTPNALLPYEMTKIPRLAFVVLYCESAGCHFADVIGAELIKFGHRNIKIYRNGYREWRGKEGRE